MKALRAMKTCKSCNRETKALRYGCCLACYQRYRYRVLKGEIQWHELELTGKASVRARANAEWRAKWAEEHPIALRAEEQINGERSES